MKAQIQVIAARLPAAPKLRPGREETLSAEAWAALAALWRAYACARDLRLDPREFSLRLLHLISLGANESDLRWLVANGYVDQADELTTFRDPARRFRPSAGRAFTSGTCFVLSEKGSLVAGRGGKWTHLPPPEPRFLPRLSHFVPSCPSGTATSACSGSRAAW